MLLATRSNIATALSSVLDDWTKKRLDLQLVTSASNTMWTISYHLPTSLSLKGETRRCDDTRTDRIMQSPLKSA